METKRESWRSATQVGCVGADEVADLRLMRRG
jgi:hypothetical protein